jgi:hypothetical protein
MSQQAISTANLSRINSALSAIENNTQAISADVSVVQGQQADLQGKVKDLDELVRDFILTNKRAQSVQLAETRILRVREELTTQFGHYGEVRRSTTGLLQALDSGLVTHGSVQAVTEEFLLTAPRYWLAPVLVALAAWSRDDEELAKRAIDEALKRDPDKTGLLLTLVLRRFQRLDAAAQWLDQYLLRQDPSALGREFVVILEAVANGGFGLAAKVVVSEFMNEWLTHFRADADFSGKQEARWADEFRLLMSTVDDSRYPTLAEHCSNWQTLKSSLGHVESNQKILDRFDDIFTGELVVPPTVQHQIDDLLTMLVTEFDVEELPLRTDEAKYQSIIDSDGDEDRAAIDFKTTQDALVKNVDFATLLTNAAMRPDEAGVTNGTQRMAVALSKDWVTHAFDSHVNRARNDVPTSVDLKIDTWSATLDGPTDVDDLAAELGKHVDEETEKEVAAIKFGGIHLAAAIGGGLVLILGLVYLNVILFVLAAGAGVYAYFGYRGLDARRDATRARGEARKITSIEALRNCGAELVDYRLEWQREDDIAEQARSFVEAINPAEHQMSRADQTREVLK